VWQFWLEEIVATMAWQQGLSQSHSALEQILLKMQCIQLK